MKRGHRNAGIAALVLLALFLGGWTWLAESDRHAGLQRAKAAEAVAARSSIAGTVADRTVFRGADAQRAASWSPNRPIRALPPLGSPLREVLASLKDQAAEGDAAAACRIAFELDRCAKLPMLRNSPSFWEQGLSRVFGRARADVEWHVQNARRMLSEAESACEGLPPEELAWTFDYAMSAALAGNRQARWMMVGVPAGLDPSRPERTLEAWAVWRQNIRGIIEAGIAAGDPRIMRIAANAYTRPEWGFRIFPEDPVRAVAMQFAIARAATPSYRATEENNGMSIARMAGLSPDQIEEARRIAATLSTKQAPEGGVEWSRGMSPSADGTDCERER